jgi:uncharacterized protein YqhQ
MSFEEEEEEEEDEEEKEEEEWKSYNFCICVTTVLYATLKFIFVIPISYYNMFQRHSVIVRCIHSC